MTRRILAVADVFPPRHGGSGRWLWELYRRMPPGSVHVAAGEHPDAVRFDQTHALPITRLPLAFSSWGVLGLRSAREYARVARLLGTLRSDVGAAVVHCAKALPEGLLGWWLQRRTGCSYWCFAHGEELTLARTSRELAWWTSVALRGAARIVANSHNTARLLQQDWGAPRDRITVLHPGVDTTRFVPATRDDAARAALGWADRRVLLTVGALQRRKGQDMVIRALPAILEACPDVLYVMAGDGPDRVHLEGLARAHGVTSRVQFRPSPADAELVTLYQQCDLFVLANRQIGWDFEGFGIVLLEAQACGKPVIAGASGGTSETLDAPRSGVLTDARDVVTLGRVIAGLLGSPDLGAMGERGRLWVTDRFDVRQSAAAFTALTEPLV